MIMNNTAVAPASAIIVCVSAGRNFPPNMFSPLSLGLFVSWGRVSSVSEVWGIIGGLTVGWARHRAGNVRVTMIIVKIAVMIILFILQSEEIRIDCVKDDCGHKQ